MLLAFGLLLLAWGGQGLRAQGAGPGLFPVQPFDSPSLSLQRVDHETEIYGRWALTTIQMDFKAGDSLAADAIFLFPLEREQLLLDFEVFSHPDRRGAPWKPLPKGISTPPGASGNGLPEAPLPAACLRHPGEQLFRIGPMPVAGMCYRVRLHLRQTLNRQNDDYVLELPLRFPQPADSFKLEMQAHGQVLRPLARVEGADFLRFGRDGDRYRGSIRRLNYGPMERVRVSLPIVFEGPQVWLGDGDRLRPFLVHVALPGDAAAPKIRSLGILWDASLYTADRDQKRDLALLDRIFKEIENVDVHAAICDRGIRRKADFAVRKGDWSALRAFLGESPPDGSQDLKAAIEAMPQSDLLLLFTAHPLPPASPPAWKGPAFLLCNSGEAPHELAVSWGLPLLQVIPTSGREAKDLAEAIRHLPLLVQGLKYKARAIPRLGLAEGSTAEGGFCFAGWLAGNAAALAVELGGAGKGSEKVKVKLAGSKQDSARTAAIAMLANAPVHLPRIYPLRLQEMYQHGMETPPHWQPWLEALKAWEEVQDAQIASEKAETLRWNRELGQEDWDLLRGQWSGRHDTAMRLPDPIFWQAPAREKSIVQPQALQADVFQVPQMCLAGDSIFENGLPPRYWNRVQSLRWLRGGSLQARFGPLARQGILWVELREGADLDPAALRRLPEWVEDAPYLRNGLGMGSKSYETYQLHLADWSSHPSFFLDWADQFIVQGERALALRALDNLLATGQREPEVLRAAAQRLLAWGAVDRALELFEVVVAERQGDPVALRDWGLALEQAGRFGEAARALEAALSVEGNLLDARFPGMRRILLREWNDLLLGAGLAADSSLAPSDFPMPMPLDLRVTCDWNRSDTDVDLVVLGPDGLRCDYDHPVSPAGGMLAGDVTDGFGPEEFSLPRAQKGKYTFYIEYEDNPERRISGPTFVLLTIYTDYGRPGEQRKLIPLRLSGQDGVVEAAGVLVE